MKVLFTLIITLFSSLSMADWVVNNQNVALDGYDPVAYFDQDQPMKGASQYTADYDGVTFWFASADHQATFKSNPEKYAPQFNGHCANGLADGHVVDGNPKHWRIIDDKLYVYFSAWGRAKWTFGVEEKIEKAWKTFDEHNLNQ